MDIVILGCGPAGLFAAVAVELAGHTPVIVSKKTPSKMFGAMYLHRAIPSVTGHYPDFQVKVVKIGSREGYAKNVYGDPEAPCSWDHIEKGSHPAWDLRNAYEKLWARYAERIVDREINADLLNSILEEYQGPVFSTIPRNVTCVQEGHKFWFQDIWVQHGEHPDIDLAPSLGNIMHYNGERYMPWYRYSLIRGYQAWEFSHEPDDERKELGFEISTGRKPLANNCDCWPRMIPLGRFGAWQKGVLTHHAYEEAERVVQSL